MFLIPPRFRHPMSRCRPPTMTACIIIQNPLSSSLLKMATLTPSPRWCAPRGKGASTRISQSSQTSRKYSVNARSTTLASSAPENTRGLALFQNLTQLCHCQVLSSIPKYLSALDRDRRAIESRNNARCVIPRRAPSRKDSTVKVTTYCPFQGLASSQLLHLGHGGVLQEPAWECQTYGREE